MKKWIYNIGSLALLSFALMACEKDEEQAVLQNPQAPSLSSSVNAPVLLEENEASNAVSFNWSDADFGYQAAITYTLQIDTAGDGFVKPYSVALGNDLEKSYTVAELNTLLTNLDYAADVAHQVPVRIMATVSDRVNPTFSNVVNLTATPYSTFVEPGYIYVPGAYQGWNPGTAPSLISVENNGVYEGVISFVGAENLEFKFTANKNWDLNYGAGDTEGSLAENGANLTVPAKDNYMVKVDLNTFTWSYAMHSWGVIGSATPDGWNSDTNLKYIPAEDVWKLTTNLTAGEIKFRFNDDWGTNYGDDDTKDNLLNSGGANIAVSSAGTYEIILDINQEEGTATYQITKK